MKKNILLAIMVTGIILTGCRQPAKVNEQSLPFKKNLEVTASKTFQTMDGFGVNLNPEYWQNGKLKPVLDSLVDDLGATLFRFDCTGLAIWLDPAKREKNGKYDEAYLEEVYTSQQFKDAWETFRYLNSKGIEPNISVSGRIPPALGRKDNPNRLEDYEGYAEMIVTMLDWARNKEGLKFSILSPFNETDNGYPEGAKILIEDIYPATKAILKKLDEYQMQDVKLILLDDASLNYARIEEVLKDSTYKDRIHAFGFHTYGDGNEFEGGGWFEEESNFSRINKRIKASPFKNSPLWMTEYGDLDLTGEIEYEFAIRSTRRLLKFVSYGFTAGENWDGIDNFHKHDTLWTTYGLIKLDTTTWNYTPKKRYYAAKQVYKYVPKGFRLAETAALPKSTSYDVYSRWRFPLRNLRVLSFTSEDKKDFTMVGISAIEPECELTINLKDFDSQINGKEIYYYRTSPTENCKLIEKVKIKDNTLVINILPRTIFTITTVKE